MARFARTAAWGLPRVQRRRPASSMGSTWVTWTLRAGRAPGAGPADCPRSSLHVVHWYLFLSALTARATGPSDFDVAAGFRQLEQARLSADRSVRAAGMQCLCDSAHNARVWISLAGCTSSGSVSGSLAKRKVSAGCRLWVTPKFAACRERLATPRTSSTSAAACETSASAAPPASTVVARFDGAQIQLAHADAPAAAKAARACRGSSIALPQPRIS